MEALPHLELRTTRNARPRNAVTRVAAADQKDVKTRDRDEWATHELQARCGRYLQALVVYFIVLAWLASSCSAARTFAALTFCSNERLAWLMFVTIVLCTISGRVWTGL